VSMQRNPLRGFDRERPIRGEIYSSERLELEAARLARSHRLVPAGRRGRLRRRLKENSDRLIAIHGSIAEGARRGETISPAAEWFLDNFHLVLEQLRQIRQDLPRHYDRELPKLAEGDLAGFPRVYGMAVAVIAHTDSRLESAGLQKFLSAYQKAAPLSIGELWAFAIALRAGLIENLRRLAGQMEFARRERSLADLLADRVLAAVEEAETRDARERAAAAWLERPGDLALHLSTPFIVRLVQRLREQDPAISPFLHWIDRRLEAEGTTLEAAVQAEHQRQTAGQATISNIIGSMRLLSHIDWSDFFEEASPVEKILRDDPSGAHALQDFATRDRYRHAIEVLGDHDGKRECAAAEAAVALAREGGAPRRRHVGFYLVDEGRPDLERVLGVRPGRALRLRRLAFRHATALYLGAILFGTAALLGLEAFYAVARGASALALAAGLLVSAIPASELALNIVNFLVTLFLSPHRLPKLEFKDGVPAARTTLVVVPCFLTGEEEVERLLNDLEIRSFANPDPNLHFALLSDFPDAPSETLPGDEPVLAAAVAGIDGLNRRSPGRFYLLHRRRLWNSAENRWMGWERKRGKLTELNRLLRGRGPTSFSMIRGDPSVFPGVRFVLTLDADTRLSRDTVRALAGALAHPLNRPVADPETGLVREGYGILQPRVSVSLESARRSPFSEISSGHTGIDPYTTAVSNVYQDLFREGSYTGKGLYDVDAFEAALEGRVPENTLLSHDLFEGCHARSGLATDIEIFEDHPSSFDVYTQRQHRWIRGDWQIVRWLLPRVPGEPGPRRNDLSGLSRWKIFDNLRRSLVAPFLLLWLAAAWLWLPGSPILWSSLVLLTIAFPIVFHLAEGLTVHPRGVPWTSHFWSVWGDAFDNFAQLALRVTFLPHLAGVSADAAVRALYRQFVSRRKLLDWTTAATAERQRVTTAAGYLRRQWRSFLLVLALGAVVGGLQPHHLPLALPFLLLWIAAPAVAARISRPFPAWRVELDEPSRRELRHRARQTWRFFERFVGDDDHGLPPDNFQEDPEPRIAHRTSPTNIGLYLLSALAARDFGYLGTLDLVERLEKTLSTVERLPRYRGHLFNWYDTITLATLPPQYVSTVDSGNLAACALVLKQACAALARGPLGPKAADDGLQDAFFFVQSEFGRITSSRLRTEAMTIGQLKTELGELAAALSGPEASPSHPSWPARLSDLDRMAADLEDGLTALSQEHPELATGELSSWLDALHRQVRSHLRDIGGDETDLRARLEDLARRAEDLAEAMDFRFLFDAQRKLFIIGFNVTANRGDNSYYDLLASEARLASFVAIAKGDVASEHWFRLQRRFTIVDDEALLLSWSGSMFEYLMPSLLMRSYPDTLLDTTCRAAVAVQIAYCRRRRVPWGISEAACNARDLQLNYQYGPFGVPRLGLRRASAEDLVVAPYATALALGVDPPAAVENLRRLGLEGAAGEYGYYESVDYTPSRLPPGTDRAIVRAYMAHHQGMILLSLVNALKNDVIREQFHADPAVQATELLLQERIPRNAAALVGSLPPHVAVRRTVREELPPPVRRFGSPHSSTPRMHLLSNGSYSVMVTTAGSGWSRRGGLAVTRWREDPTRDCWGSWIYLRDVRSGVLWSSGFHPTARRPRGYEARFYEHKAEIARLDTDIETLTEIVVSPEEDVELRRVSLTNLSTKSRDLRDIEVTSYAEIVLVPPDDDRAHPAFSSLFVETEMVGNAVLCRRRPRSAEEAPVFAVHLITAERGELGGPQYETDRARFLGRGSTPQAPAAVVENRPLSNTVGPVLDPIVSWRQRVRVPPGATVRLVLVTAVADSREAALALADKYRDPASFDRAASLAWMRSQVLLRHLNITGDESQVFQRLALRAIYDDPSLRPKAELLARNRRPQRGLWAHGISGDFPIILVKIAEAEEIELFRQLLRAHEYWRLKGLAVDLVIVNEDVSGYLQPLQEEMAAVLDASPSRGLADKPGGVFLRRADLIPEEDQILLDSVARAVLIGANGPLAAQVERTPFAEVPEPEFVPAAPRPPRAPETPPETGKLAFFNGVGGFSEDGREYVLVLKEGQWTPCPWANVVANPGFGFFVSESGSGCVWAGNSHENRLTPWSNDPVSDPAGEAVYLRDEDTGEVWTPTALPIREPETYLCRHGQGYSLFEHSSHGIAQELLVFAAADAPLKVCRLRLRNASDEPRRISATYYVEWVLGVDRTADARHLVTELEPATGALLARNPYSEEYGSDVAFAHVVGGGARFTADRREFLGRNGSPSSPAAMSRSDLSGRLGAGLDPCAALQVVREIASGETAEIVFLLGQTSSREEAVRILSEASSAGAIESLRQEAQVRWDAVLGAVTVRTPDAGFNVMMNRWLLYQTLSCRVWGRSAFYQSSGAYGFRDQLQDVLALTAAAPGIAREQIVRAASRQFVEGDVQHWWHPPHGRGVRTRCSDDRLWLPFAVAEYLDATGDRTLLEESAPFLEGEPLEEDAVEAYQEPKVSESAGSVYEHCLRAIDSSLSTGAHGLPLIGSCDWNDGYNRVGFRGKGESVWLGWFLHHLLGRFAPLCESRGDGERASRYLGKRERLKLALEEHGWDGDWYRRAYYDDGTPLGSSADRECRIDSLAQSWSLLSGAADRVRAERAMVAVDEYLVNRAEGLILIFTPPFDRSPRDPGYVKGYLPGIRENGGQYTHAAIWTAMAFARLGDGDRVGELLAMLNPISHTTTRTGLHRYKVEPYVIAGDVYSVAPHIGRGGWTWYTGSAAWFHRAGLESFLGFRLRGDCFSIEPCLPRHWKSYEIDFRDGDTLYRITVENPKSLSGGPALVELDGAAVPEKRIARTKDGKTHTVRVVLGE
jgi:cyclic beta-1,2-glucan synthetase